MDTRKSTHIIGRRTRVNVLEGKTIRKLGDGGDVFEDYWTDSDEEISNHSTNSSHFFDLSVKSQNVLSNQDPSDVSDSNQMGTMPKVIRQAPERKAKLSKSSLQTSSPLSSKILQMSAMSETVKRTPERKAELSKSIIQTISPISSKILQVSAMSENVKRTPERKAKLAKSSTQANSPLSKTLHIKTMEIVKKTPERKTKLSNSSIQANSPLSKTFYKNRMSSSMHLQKSIVRNLDKEVLLEMSSSASNNEEELVLSASMQNSETAQSLKKNKVRRKSTLLTEKILSNYDKYDAVIMKMIDGEEENNEDSPQHSAENASPKSDISKLNDNDITCDSSPVNNSNEQDNFDTNVLTSIENINDKSGDINSTLKSNSRDNEISSLSSHTSEKELPIEEMQTTLNVSKSVNKTIKIKEKENSQRPPNASNSDKTLNSMPYGSKSISNIAENQLKEVSYLDNDKVPGKMHTKNKKKSLKSVSSDRYIDYDPSTQERNEANSPSKSLEKHENSNEKCSSRHNIQFAANSNIVSKKQAVLVDEANNVAEYEHNVSNHELQQSLPNTAAELHFSESSSSEKSYINNETNEFERQAGKEDGQASKEQNSSNFSNEEDQLHIDSFPPKRDDIGSKGKQSTELKISQNQVTGKGKEISQFNSRNYGELISVMNSERNEQLPSMPDDNHFSLRSKRKYSSQSSSTERKSHNKKKNKSTVTKPGEYELQQISVNELSAIQELCANNPQSPKNARNKNCPPTKSKTHAEKFRTEKEVRRSGRQRYTPLAHWRNERLLYRFEKGEIKVLGIDEGFGGDDFKTPNALRKKKNIKPSRIKKISLYDNKLQKKVRTCMYKPFHSVEWTIFDENTPYRIKRVFDTVNSAFGYLQIDAFEKKPSQQMPDEDVHLTVIKGEVEIKVQETSFKVQEKDMFIIPRYTAYSVTNITSKKALLLFTVGKFKFLENAH